MFMSAASFDQHLNHWNVASVTSMGFIFWGASGLSDCNKALIASTWFVSPAWQSSGSTSWY